MSRWVLALARRWPWEIIKHRFLHQWSLRPWVCIQFDAICVVMPSTTAGTFFTKHARENKPIATSRPGCGKRQHIKWTLKIRYSWMSSALYIICAPSLGKGNAENIHYKIQTTNTTSTKSLITHAICLKTALSAPHTSFGLGGLFQSFAGSISGGGPCSWC